MRSIALSQSLPTPNTHEPLRVVVRLAVGKPDAAFALALAPIAPEPFVPEVSTPVKVTIVREAAVLLDRVAVTATLVSTPGANARHTSAVPRWVLVRCTNTQVRLPPVMLETVVLVPEVGASVATNASSNSFVEFVENVGEERVVLEVLRSVDVFTSIPMAANID
ncbi:MAG: hypothetical protein ACR65R_03185 [Methylomicrobium sp.]